MKCWHCNCELIWDCDYDYGDIYGDGEGIVTYLHCSNCKAEYEVILKPEDDE